MVLLSLLPILQTRFSGAVERVSTLSPGAGINDQERNILTNQTLLLRTFRSVAPVLADGDPSSSVQRKRHPSPTSSLDSDADAEDAEYTEAAPSRGTLLITLLDIPPYTLWGVKKLATRPPPTFERLPTVRYRLVRSFEFQPDLWPGYEHRRTIGWREGLSKGGNAEVRGRRPRTWEFEVMVDGDG